ncbi:GYDIA family GHMP kinase [Alkalitalea saponilacus]|uniref:Mevalonate kinase n=1 Tax=Alkalitalea saponilacus TaxID=889453 RepID=A0A1T5HSH5_9BACT|nr:GYDIA family GHMP kinase [Alkalitalea saponilacus]ASB47713.1 hypothetical protein CDL62_00360 [Alkalitalea saponilacus]SKC23639.1 Mevalonate kinase [Alkalitalea saponilacus]
MYFHANGKLLITGEYLVLNGAKALAVPLKKGQSMKIEEDESNGFIWKAMTPEGLWFQSEFDRNLNIIKTTSSAHAEKLKSILETIIRLNPDANKKLINQRITTQLEFQPDWGWGSSSTLISLLSQWLETDAYQFLQQTFGGSGYDLACATSHQPLFFRIDANHQPTISPVQFSPPFMEQIGVVWLNNKQTSSVEIERFKEKQVPVLKYVDDISKISEEIVTVTDIKQFCELLNTHEEIIGKVTGLTPVKRSLFPEFNGTMKSLGAWGGDFTLFISDEPFSSSAKWFSRKGYQTSFRLKDIMI